MLVRVNKKISAAKTAKYAALSTGTVSHVWYDEESASGKTPKRQNRIRMTRASEDASPRTQDSEIFDA